MKCIRTAQIHDYNSNIIYIYTMQTESKHKKHTHLSTYRYDLTDDVNEAAYVYIALQI